MKRVQSIFLALIVALALAVRLGGIGYGLPELIHTDEARIILDSMSMGQRLSLLSEDVNYPLFTKYILTFSYGAFFVVGKLIGLFKDRVDLAVRFLTDPSAVVLLSRIVMAALGTIGVVLAYYWGKIIDRSVKTGLIAALFVAVEWQLVLESQYALHQTLAALTSTIAFFGMSYICLSESRKAYAIGGIAMGLAIASHQTTVLFFPALLFLFLSNIIEREKPLVEILKRWFLFSFLAILIGILGNLNYIFQFDKSMKFFLQGSGAAKVAFSSASYFSYDLPSIIVWYFAEFVRRNYIIGLVVLLGAVHSLVRRKKLDVLYIIICVTYFIFFYKWAFRWMHLFVGLIPISLLFAAKSLSDLTNRLRLSSISITLAVMVLALVSLNVLDVVKMDLMKQNRETRQLAKDWVEQNIPKGTRIAVDYPAHAVPLEAKYPTILRNRVARAYFDNSVPEGVKNKYLEFVNTKNTYEIVDLIDSKIDPVWPSFMPEDSIRRASSNPTMRDIYGYFNFRPFDQILSEGAKYIVITSYTYGMFLYSDDPRKIYLANTYIKDDVLPFFNHGHEIERGTQHELMYYVAKRGRDYFSQLLNNDIPGVRLIKEFSPSDRTSGPVVKIYAVK
ncbi:hypothetical protein A3J19_04970 [Candidatus Daviesbacteria bacterium RIFCSPLOWO2_02_FULL_41_8]|uniref:ArnT-like N-terminal domain-containing protein n=1 Tax=Candidatus Daviesbacteria bacterium RIFCSPLOWO2_02_FULL_41_8 TaxID=1797798 RepID=A0A1F5NIV8_9BACT|nr:MAG: hypothetical protein A3J19_04970 [Candidatus Daviesbacteria bacterium RIFCSPLOWO2_02_FULL_41_8]